MAEITAVSVTLTLFLTWRLFVVGHKLRMAETMLWGIIEGKVSITKTEKGIEMEIKDNG